MKAIILTAGYGRRMRPLTDDNHKTLLPIAGIPIINRIINVLLDCEIDDIVIVTGYMHNEMQSHLTHHYPDTKISYVHNEKFAETNNIFSLALAFEQVEIDSDIILIESDLIFDPSVLRRLINNRNGNVALVDKYRTGMDGTVVTVQDHKITNVIPPHIQSENFDFSDKFKTLNIYKFSKEFASTTFKKLLIYYARVIDDNCYYELILGILIFMQREVIYAEVLDGEKWAEVDDPNDLGLASYVFEPENQLNVLNKAFGGYWNYDITDFCFIRNMYFPNGSMISEIKSNLDHLLFNYGSKQSILNKKLAYFLLCNEERVQLLNGASQVYPFLQEKFKASKVLMPNPSFGEYERIFNDKVYYSDEVGFDQNEIESKATTADVVVIVNPNNPTGSKLSTHWIYNLAQKHANKYFIIDESFIEFSDEPSIMELLEKQPVNNILIIKSLSKSLGVPGIRLGYCYTSDSTMLNEIKSYTPIWNSNSIAEFFLEIILKHRNALQLSFDKTKVDRDHFISNLMKITIVEEVYDSAANFILAKLTISKDECNQLANLLLRDHSIYIKILDNKFENGAYIRLAVRTPEDHEFFLASLKDTIAKKNSNSLTME